MLKKVHEDKDDEDKVEVPNPATDARWLKWLHDSGFDTFAKAANGPTNAPPNPDQLADDQSEMTYSFNIGDVHFIVINTDTLTTDIDNDTNAPHIGWIPYHWIEQDVRSAQANPKVSAIFLIGHKPIMDHPRRKKKAILNTKKHPLGDQLQALFQANDKVRAYLCAHEHLWDCSRLETGPAGLASDRGQCRQQAQQQVGPARRHFLRLQPDQRLCQRQSRSCQLPRPTPMPPQKYFEGAPVSPAAAQPQPEVILYPGSRS